MLINLQFNKFFYELERLSQTLSNIDLIKHFYPFQFGIYRITCVHNDRTEINKGLSHMYVEYFWFYFFLVFFFFMQIISYSAKDTKDELCNGLIISSLFTSTLRFYRWRVQAMHRGVITFKVRLLHGLQ